MNGRQERVALERIVALLLSLADLADLASGRSPAMCAFLLWFLRPAEVFARDFVDGSPSPVGPDGDSVAEAARLAQSFRALARELERQARFTFGVAACPTGPALRALAENLARSLGNAFASPSAESRPHDTS